MQKRLFTLSASLKWLILILLSIATSALLLYTQLPGALMLGPMLAAIVVTLSCGELKIPKPPYAIAQAVIGCLIARSINSAIVATFSERWLLFVLVVFVIIGASCSLGWILSRLKILPGTTAIWGLLPGAATAMIIMSEEFGADSRLVAFMQYLRVVCVALAASVVARVFAHSSSAVQTIHHPTVIWFPPIDINAFFVTIGLILIGVLIGPRSRMPAGVMFLPMVIGGAVHVSNILPMQLPQWLLATSYTILGWSVGVRFTRDVFAHAAAAFFKTLISIVLLILFCGALASVFVRLLNVDPLTAYLATSPGGMDSVAIIAATSKVDVSFVMALQTVRFLFVLAFGPAISKLVASKLVASKLVASKLVLSELHHEQLTYSADDSSLLIQVKGDESELD